MFFCVLIGPDASLLVSMGLYMSLCVPIDLMGAYGSLQVFNRRDGFK